MANWRPTVGSLFSGCGGFDIGFDRAGFDVKWQVEIDRTCRDVLARHWLATDRHEDVCKVGSANLCPVDVVVGGFPCQDLSTAGKRAGFSDGERSVLFFEMARIIRELQPGYVVWENVPGLLTSGEGRDFLAVLVELDRLGFDGGWRTVDAQFFGVPQQRRRVFGVFARGHSGAERAAEVLALAEGVCRRTPSRRKTRAGVARTLTAGVGSGGSNPAGRRQEDDFNLVVGSLGATGDGRGHRLGADEAAAGHLVVFGGGDTNGERGVAATLTAKGGTRQDFDTENFVLRVCQTGANGDNIRRNGPAFTLNAGGSPQAVAFNWQSGGDCRINPSPLADALSVCQTQAVCVNGPVVRRLTPRECERLMGWPDDHTRFRVDGREIADGPRYRMCGNGVVGTVAEWLARRLKAVMADSEAA